MVQYTISGGERLKKGSNNHLYVIGYWSSILFTLTGILYGISMGILISNYMIPKYDHLEQFISLVDGNFIDLYTFSQLFAFISTIFYMVMLSSIHESVETNQKIYSRLSNIFGIGFMILACLNYFVQFSIVRLKLNAGVTSDLENFVQFNPLSFSFAMNILAWSLFLGLSTFFLGMIYKGKGLNFAIRVSFYITSVFCFIGFISFILDIQSLMTVFQMGMTFGLTVGAIFLAIAFRRRIKRI